MGRKRVTGAGRWRWFRHDAGVAAGPPPWAYVLLFAAAQLIGLWSAQTFHATVLWPANAVLVAALLQLHRRSAIAVLMACVAINIGANVVRGDPLPFVFINSALNLLQAMIAAVLARRVCGAALDMRRPGRLLRFALCAAIAVGVSTVLAGAIALGSHRIPLGGLAFRLHHLFDMELLAMLIVTPSLLLVARNHRFKADAVAKRLETAVLVCALAAVAIAVFAQTSAPVLFLVLPPVILLAFRLSPPWTAASIIIVAAIGGVATVTGHGPVALTVVEPAPDLAGVPDVMRRMGVFHLFLLTVIATALPISTMSTERRALFARLKRRTQAAVAALQRAQQADAAKSRFLALMSHEMRTPLMGVSGYSDILSRAPELSGESQRQVRAIQGCGETMLRLVEDLLELARGGEEVALEPVDPRAMIETAVASARERAASHGLTFDLTLAPDVGERVVTDHRRLGQALHHIVNNAVKFTREGGVRVHVDRDGERLRIGVADTGCGMSPAVLCNIFRLFEQADASITRMHEGAGVGLALAKAHMDRLGGTISVESVEGEGSRFTIDLPAPAAQVAASTETASVEDAALRVLIVDDHPANRDLLRIMMQAGGCETEEAVDGAQAVAAVAERPFDLVLMDVRMPGMDGLAATRAIRALPTPASQAPILAVTADAMPEDAARCLAAGMDHHLAKPVTQAKLYEAVETTLDLAARRRQAAA
jgi:two-component system, sensor histidine kinase